jgi:hypothetical protein
MAIDGELVGRGGSGQRARPWPTPSTRGLAVALTLVGTSTGPPGTMVNAAVAVNQPDRRLQAFGRGSQEWEIGLAT